MVCPSRSLQWLKHFSFYLNYFVWCISGWGSFTFANIICIMHAPTPLLVTYFKTGKRRQRGSGLWLAALYHIGWKGHNEVNWQLAPPPHISCGVVRFNQCQWAKWAAGQRAPNIWLWILLSFFFCFFVFLVSYFVFFLDCRLWAWPLATFGFFILTLFLLLFFFVF